MSVIIYSKNGCTPCEQAKRWFAERGIPFEVRNLDDKAMGKRYTLEYLELDLPEGGGFPAIVWGEETICGYSQKRFNELAERADKE